MNGRWVSHDKRDEVVDFVRNWATKIGLLKKRFIGWIGVSSSKFFDWQNRYGKVNEHKGWIPRDHGLEEWECEAIVDYWRAHPGEGYQRPTYMMLDEDVVAASASTDYRVLSNVGAPGDTHIFAARSLRR